MKQYLIMLLAAAGWLCACERDQPPLTAAEGESVEVQFDINAEEDLCKSGLGLPLNSLGIVDIYIYDSGELRHSLSFSRDAGGRRSFSFSTELIVGNRYDILVVANSTDHTPYPTLDEAMEKLVYYSGGVTNLKNTGIPMSGCQTVVPSPYTSHISIPLTRLAAQLVLKVNYDGLTHGRMIFSSAKVCQMNTVCPFFSDGTAGSAADVTDGDFASVGDVALLNAGWEAELLILENKQGTLLPANTDPDKKAPEYLRLAGKDPGLCTYIELEGEYVDFSGELKAEPVTMRFYLGSDACTNFDICRNWQYRVILSFTDAVCFRADWKVSSSRTDTRYLYFDPPSSQIRAGESKTIQLRTNVYYNIGDFSYELRGPSSSYFDVEFVPNYNQFEISAQSGTPVGSQAEIVVSTWDGSVSASHRVQTVP